MDQGIAVFGASSMGALRAAELHAFGMIGVGSIFEDFRDGRLEDDDEVALRHGPSEMNYIALSEPMVNIRASLEQAVSDGVLGRSAASDLISLAKSMYFPERTWDALQTIAKERGIDRVALESLRAWLASGRVDQKQRDAVAMLNRMQASSEDRSVPDIATFDFQHTVMWETLKRRCDTTPASLPVALILDTVRRDPDRYRALRRRAADTLVREADWDVPPDVLGRALTQFRTENKLYTGVALTHWLEENGLDLEALQARLAQDILLGFVITDAPAVFRDALLGVLAEDGLYDAFWAEAKKQAKILHDAGYDMSTSPTVPMPPATLLVWYFEEALGQAVPHDIDLFVQSQDFADRGDFEQMMARQYLLWQHDREKET
jgi:hypothetical protein